MQGFCYIFIVQMYEKYIYSTKKAEKVDSSEMFNLLGWLIKSF